jgi:hypothetical protein
MPEYEGIIERLSKLAEGAEKRRLRRSARHVAELFRALDRRSHDLEDISDYVNQTEELLAANPTARGLSRIHGALLAHLKKAHGLVPPGYYRSEWMAIGMAAFGIPIGVAFGVAVDNTAFVGIGLPIGLAIGLSLGGAKDKEAARKGLQLDMPESG